MRSASAIVWVLFASMASCARVDVELLDAPPLDAPRGVAQCQGHPCACVNGVDDDGDGHIDGLDDACTGAHDDDEASFGIAPLRAPECLDCFFDANEGSGDDQCRVASSCREAGLPSAMGSCASCEVEAECLANCLPLVPNGCDCFGCCGIEREGDTHVVVLAEGCTADTLDDPLLCPPCVQDLACLNPCERCELCPGRAELPADCAPTCAEGTACTNDCGEGQACVLGCCLAVAG